MSYIIEPANLTGKHTCLV